jgi:hypothetical protein
MMSRDGFLICVVIVTLMATDLRVTTGFNVDTEHAVKYQGTRGSMFGFSVAAHRDRGSSW